MSRNIPQIVSQMTLEEKAGLCSGEDFWHLKSVERLGIPRVMVSDGPHGLRKQEEKGDHLGINESIKAVCFPTACATAASFDEQLLERLGDALGRECRAEDVSVLLGPAVNIKRSPLCGRNFEYFSEEPYLAGKLSAAHIRGVQKWQVGTSIKHFAANNQEYRRMTSSSDLSERTLREIYLPAFETAVKEASSLDRDVLYNRINGEYASESRRLLTDILREEWGFDGYVVSDWGAVNDRVKGLAAGLELEMPASGGANDRRIVEAVRSGELAQEVLDRAVTRILNILFRYVDAKVPAASFDRAADHALAAELETECAVLLKNEGALPLPKDLPVAYIGGFAKTPRYQGGGSSHINASFTPGAADLAGDNVQFAMGFPADRDESDEELFCEAVAAAQHAQAAVIFAGLPDSFESEGYDRAHMRLPACQDELIRRVCAVQKNTVVVLHNGSPIEMPWADDVAAILEMYLGGEGVAEAAHALLYGDRDPSGRLPETFPLRLEDTPCYLHFPGDGEHVEYAEGVYVGYRYYDSKKLPVLFPFGHGLSYTSFAYGEPTLSRDQFCEGERVTVEVPVTNTGARRGKEVVQLYVKDCTGTPCRPEKELKGFVKIELAPGESGVARFEIDARSLSWYSEKLGDWYAASGRYELLIGRSSRAIEKVLPVKLKAQKHLPLQVDENTPVGDLLADSRTAAFIGARAGELFAAFGGGGEAGQSAVSDEMNRQMIENAPLRTVKSFGGLDDKALQALIAELNALLQ